jgi:hypothetical protein
VGNPFQRDELPLFLVTTLEPFDKWAIEFVGPINPLVRCNDTCYIITTIEYLARWVEATPVKDCTIETAMRFIFDNIITTFGCPWVLMS